MSYSFKETIAGVALIVEKRCSNWTLDSIISRKTKTTNKKNPNKQKTKQIKTKTTKQLENIEILLSTFCFGF